MSLLKSFDDELTDADWRVERKRKRRRLACEIANDDPAERLVELWERNTLYMTLETICCSMGDRFGKNREFLKSLAMFAPSYFQANNERNPNCE